MSAVETTITTPATARDLASLVTVKLDLGITGTADDALLARLIRRASDTIAAATGRTFGIQTRVDTFRRRWCEPIGALLLSAWPVRPGAVVVDVSSGATLAAGTDYYLDAEPGLLTVHRHRGDVTVTYSAGYVLPGDAAQTLPGDLEEICTDLIAAAYSGHGRDPTIQSETVEGVGTVRYRDGNGAMDLDETLLARLNPYSCR